MFTAIVVGTDGSASAREAVRQAAELAAGVSARLEIVCAVEQREGVDAALHDAIERARGAGVDARTHVRLGDPAEAILDVAEEQHADLIVVGNKGTTGVERFLLGSVPERVSHHAPCSVLIIRA